MPISRPPRGDGTQGTFPHFVDRSKPGVIAVTRSGRRFVNEAHSYHDFCQAMVARCAEEGGEPAAWFVADHRAFRKYGLGYAKPAPVPFGKLVKQGYLLTGETPEALARAIGADESLPEAAVAATHAGLQRFPPQMMRSEGYFGAEVSADDADDAQTQMLKFAGRSV